jgi:hypothetical protein
VRGGQVAGNHLVIQTPEGFLWLSHLQRGSLRHRCGDTVRRGDFVGRCGNSGNSSDPHLHIHMQDDPRLNTGRGIPPEYIVIWATSICSHFTHFARLAGFNFWGEAGGHSWTKAVVQQFGPHGLSRLVEMPRPSAFAMMPQTRLADLPEIDVLTTYH